MSIKYKLTIGLFVCCLAILTACSSSTSSSSGRGQIPTGIYAGVFNGQAQMPTRVTSTRAQLSIITPVTTGAIDNESISGTLAITGGDRCFAGGSVTSGSVNGNQMNLIIDTIDGVAINMNGTVTDDTYNGTFTADDSGCFALTGGFEFNRE